MNKKGVEMSMQVVVVAVIVLLIAALLIYMVTKTMKGGSETLSDCTSKGGQCKGSCDPGEQHFVIADSGCDGSQCCINGDNLFK